MGKHNKGKYYTARIIKNYEKEVHTPIKNLQKEAYDDMKDAASGCLMTILSVALGLVLELIYAAIACWLWGLIMVPVFAMPALSYWQMYGIIVLIRMLIPTNITASSKD